MGDDETKPQCPAELNIGDEFYRCHKESGHEAFHGAKTQFGPAAWVCGAQ